MSPAKAEKGRIDDHSQDGLCDDRWNSFVPRVLDMFSESLDMRLLSATSYATGSTVLTSMEEVMLTNRLRGFLYIGDLVRPSGI